MIFTINELKEKITPIAKKYNLNGVYIFGSYARAEADENSDVDILIDRTGSKVKSMFDMGGLYNDLYDAIGKDIDIVTTQTLAQKSTQIRTPFLWKISMLKG